MIVHIIMESHINETPLERKRRLTRERQRRYRSKKMSDDEREQFKKRTKEKLKCYRENLSEERKEILRKRAREKQKRYLERMSNEKREQQKKRDREKQKRYIEKLSNENMELLKKRAREKQKRYMERLSNEKREKLKQNARKKNKSYREKLQSENKGNLKKLGKEKQQINVQGFEANDKECSLIEKTAPKDFDNFAIGQLHNDIISDNYCKNNIFDYDEIFSVKESQVNLLENEKKQCCACGIILSDHEGLIKHIKNLHSKEFQLIESLRSDIVYTQKYMSFKQKKMTKDEIKPVRLMNDTKFNTIGDNGVISTKPESIIYKALQGGKKICHKCGLITLNQDLLECHTKAKHQEKCVEVELLQDLKYENIQCPICEENCTIGKLLGHMNTVHFLKSSNSFKCEDCGLVFVSDDCLTSHYTISKGKISSLNVKVFDMYSYTENNVQEKISISDTHTSANTVKMYTCKLCDYVNRFSFIVLKHVIKTHLNIFQCPLECPFCEFKTSRYKIKKHIKSMHPDINTSSCFVCEACGYTSLKKMTFKFHVRSHFTKYECEYCDYTTSLLTSINIHRRKHTKQKPYKCDYEGCQYRCNNKSSLTIHNFIHYPEKYLQSCDICGFRTVNKYTMNSHLKDHSKGQDMFSCVQCSYLTNIKANLVSHLTVHKEVTPCTMCDFTTKYNQIMKKHMQSKHGIVLVNRWCSKKESVF